MNEAHNENSTIKLAEESSSKQKSIFKIAIESMGDEDIYNNNNDKKNKQVTEPKILDNIVEDYGYGFLTIKHINLYNFAQINEGILNSVFQLMVIPYQELLHLSLFMVQLMSNIYNVSNMIAAPLVNYPLKYYNANQLQVILSVLMSGLYLVQGFITTIPSIMFVRFIAGIIVCFRHIYGMEILIEYLPVKGRGFTMSIPYAGLQIGQILILLSMLIVMPNLEHENIWKVCVILAVIELVLGYLYYAFGDIGPRRHLLAGNNYEAREIIDELNNSNISDDKFNQIKAESNKKIYTKMNGSLSDLFIPRLRKITIIMIISKILSSILLSGWSIALPLILHKMGREDKSVVYTNNDIIKSMIISASIGFLRPIVSCISDVPFFGRIRSLYLSSFVSGLFILLLIHYKNSISLISGLALIFIGANSTIMYNYVAEIYPSKVLSSANGLCSGAAAFGCLISQVIFVYMINYSIMITIYFSFVVAMLNGIVCMGLTEETYGKGIDSHYD